MNSTLSLGTGSTRFGVNDGNSLTRAVLASRAPARSTEIGLDSNVASTPAGLRTLQALALEPMLGLPDSNLTDFEAVAL